MFWRSKSLETESSTSDKTFPHRCSFVVDWDKQLRCGNIHSVRVPESEEPSNTAFLSKFFAVKRQQLTALENRIARLPHDGASGIPVSRQLTSIERQGGLLCIKNFRRQFSALNSRGSAFVEARNGILSSELSIRGQWDRDARQGSPEGWRSNAVFLLNKLITGKRIFGFEANTISSLAASQCHINRRHFYCQSQPFQRSMSNEYSDQGGAKFKLIGDKARRVGLDRVLYLHKWKRNQKLRAHSKGVVEVCMFLSLSCVRPMFIRSAISRYQTNKLLLV